MNWLVSYLYKLLHFLGVFTHSTLAGELDVIGAGGVTIDIGNSRRVISVTFEEDESIVLPPCGGGLPDELDWQLVKVSKHEYMLEITWNVQRPRRVLWIVSRR